MPAKSEAQRRLLFSKFGEKWCRAHHYANKGKLPARMAKESLSARAMFDRERLTEGRDDATKLPLGRAGHAYARMTSKDVLTQPGGTANKWRKNLALRKEVTNQQHVRNSKGATVFPSMDKVGKVPRAIKDSRTAMEVVQALLA